MSLLDDPENCKRREGSRLEEAAISGTEISSALTESIRGWHRTIGGRNPIADCVKLLEFATRGLLEKLTIEKTVHPSLADISRQVIWDELYEMAESMDIAPGTAHGSFRPRGQEQRASQRPR